jgi:mycofactocin precursor
MDSTSLSTITTTTNEAPISDEAFTPVNHENDLAENALPQAQAQEQASSAVITVIAVGEMQLEEEDDEIEEELIIEDFTIDGICGVY